MRSVASGFLAILLTSAFSAGELHGQSPAASKEKKEETCAVSGTVVKAADGGPLKGATVRLIIPGDREHSIAVKTNVEGKFELKNLPSGRYKMYVSRNGYVQAEYGQRSPNDPGGVLTLTPGMNKNELLFRLIASAVILGRIFDEDGEPVPNANVGAIREAYREGKRTLVTQGMAQTNDLGEYRLFGLKPGHYYVSAVEPNWNRVSGDRQFTGENSQTGEQGRVKTYYPGTTEVAKASMITVKAGDEIPSADITLRQVFVYHVRGRVHGPGMQKVPSGIGLMLTPRTGRYEWDQGSWKQIHREDGSFEFTDVPPGNYEISASWNDEGKKYSALQAIQIGAADVDGVSLVLSPGSPLTGRVEWEGKPSLGQPDVRVFLEAESEEMRWGGQARVEPEGNFTIQGVPEGNYRVKLFGLGKDAYIKSVQYGESAVTDEVFSVGKGGTLPLHVVVSSHAARLLGTVADENGLPIAGIQVVVIPEAEHRKNPERFKSETTDQYGRFEIHGVVPGEYKLFSWDTVEEQAWEDPEFLKTFEAKGLKVEVREDEAKNVSLTAIQTNSASERRD